MYEILNVDIIGFVNGPRLEKRKEIDFDGICYEMKEFDGQAEQIKFIRRPISTDEIMKVVKKEFPGTELFLLKVDFIDSKDGEEGALILYR